MVITFRGTKEAMREDKKIILKVLVGSRAHGLANKNSDRDYRAVYVLPTSKILSIGYKYKGNSWIEGDEDNTAYEIGHFLNLAIQCNPSILEVFQAPIVEMNEDGEMLRKIMSWCWTPQKAFDAFVGYGLNQRKKFLSKKDERPDKYACAYIRTLIALHQLLTYETFDIKVPVEHRKLLRRIKKGNYRRGEIIDISEKWTEKCEFALSHCRHQSGIASVNSVLLDIRKKYW